MKMNARLYYRGYWPSSCPSVCPIVTRRYCVKTAKRTITPITPRDSPGILVFWRQQSLVGDPNSSWNWRSKWSTPFRTQRFRPMSADSASTVRASKNVQLALIGSRPRAFQWAIDEPCTLPQSPQKVAQDAILRFLPVQFIFCRKKSAAEFFCAKISRDKVVTTSFLHLTVRRQIASDVPIYLEFTFKVTHPYRKCLFQHISLNSASSVKASVKLSIITNSKSTVRFSSSHRWTLCCALPLSPQRVAQTENAYIFSVAFLSSL